MPPVEPLLCPHCGGPVPLADSDAVSCPYCTESVHIPENLRALRRELTSLVEERRVAERLYKRVGKAPPRILRAFAFFDSAWFWMLAFGFWLVGGIVFFTMAIPWFCAHVLSINSDDVIPGNVQMAITWGGTLGSVALGLLASGYSRKRVVTLGSLQSALAASPPTSPGGPSRCRRCGAALGVAPGALGARCDYCRADNLVEIPSQWVQMASKLVKRIADEEGAATREVDQAFSELRTSLILRLILGTVLTVPALMFLFMKDSTALGFDVASADVFKPPRDLPVWTKDYVPTWECNGEHSLYFHRFLDHCDNGVCMDGFLVALNAKRPLHVYVRGGGAVQLDARATGTLGVSWKRVGLEAAGPEGATFVPPLKGWYRVIVLGDARGAVQVCDHQD